MLSTFVLSTKYFALSTKYFALKYNILEQDATIIIRLERGSDVLLTGAVFYIASNCTELTGTVYGRMETLCFHF